MTKEIFICGKYCFIPSADFKGLWFRAHRCVAYIRCEHCGAEIGQPCRGPKGKWNYDTHHTRRKMYSKLLQKTGDFRKRTAVTVTIEDRLEQ